MMGERWQDRAMLIAGARFAVSAWVIGHADPAGAVLYNAVAAGMVVLLCAGRLAKPEAREPVVTFIAGLWAARGALCQWRSRGGRGDGADAFELQDDGADSSTF